LVESFSDVESMFGTKTNAFLTRTTTVLSVLFFVTCLSLAVLSIKQSRSLMRNAKPETLPAGGAMPLVPSAELPKQVPQQLPKPEEKPAPAPTQEAPKAESRTF